MGDLLFAVVALARRLRVNPEEALRGRSMALCEPVPGARGSRTRGRRRPPRPRRRDLARALGGNARTDTAWGASPCQKRDCSPSYADTRRHIVPFVSLGAQAEERVIRPTPRPTLDSPITLRRIAVVLIAGICGLVAFAVYGQVAQSRHLDAQVTALAAQNASLEQQISDSEREIADAQTVAWLEQEARQLGYVFPGEHLYQFVPAGWRTQPRLEASPFPCRYSNHRRRRRRARSASAKPSPTPTPTARPVTISPTPTPAPH